jgi:hypothetical protein
MKSFLFVGSHRLYTHKRCLSFLVARFVVKKRKCDWGNFYFCAMAFPLLIVCDTINVILVFLYASVIQKWDMSRQFMNNKIFL